jgi:hypothetical protein
MQNGESVAEVAQTLWNRTTQTVVGQVKDFKVFQLAYRIRNLTCQFIVGRKNKDFQILLFEN